jgi:Na+-transporting NADH:ubiquinone oxidoreductase subunit NqrD
MIERNSPVVRAFSLSTDAFPLLELVRLFYLIIAQSAMAYMLFIVFTDVGEAWVMAALYPNVGVGVIHTCLLSLGCADGMQVFTLPIFRFLDGILMGAV